jgi:hypothetical protein
VHNVTSPGEADISIDHPFSADTTFDVNLDEPYWSLARELTSESEGHASKHELHMELETGAFPHSLSHMAGPTEGEPWDLLPSEVKERETKKESTDTLLQDASIGLETGYIPQTGDRIALRGRWLIDCGHPDFHGELHPITFMAFGHAAGSKTIVHILANPYRVTQLYGPGTSELNPSTPKGQPFPEAFEQAVTNLVVHSVFSATPFPLALLGGIERSFPTPAPVIVCAPEGVATVKTTFGFVKRLGVKIKVQRSGTCATISVSYNKKYTVMEPAARTCDMPWLWLSTKIAEALGVSEARANEIETIRVNATGGTFTISYGSEKTAGVAYNATAAQVQSALEAMPPLKGNITVTGGPGGSGGGTPYTLTFVGGLAEKAVTPVTTDRSALTGGAKLASVVVIKPGGVLDLRRFVLSLIEQRQKVSLEEAGAFTAITRIESNVSLTPKASCLTALTGPTVGRGMPTDNTQPLPFYGEVRIGGKTKKARAR